MKILLTGASSFTGVWFAEALAIKGHTIFAPLLRKREEYQGMRDARVSKLSKYAKMIFDCPFGSPQFLKIIDTEGPFDLLCHHAADVSDYKSQEFDFARALSRNTFQIKAVLEKLKSQGCQKILLTGSIFEQGEGLSSSDNLNAVSPYGLSKGLTSDVFRYFSQFYHLKLGKFVIPNPFGPFEEARFTTYLANCWLKKEKAVVSFPEYIRDNIHVSLLAKSYASFAEKLTPDVGYCKLNPSFRPCSQSCFVEEFSKEMKIRFNLPCEFEIKTQTEFIEPKIRINQDPLDLAALGWDESLAWNELAHFYLQTFGNKGL